MPAPLIPLERHPGIYRRGTRYAVRFRDPQGRVRQRSARTIAEAKALRATLQADVHRGEFRELSRMRFEDYAREWIRLYQGRTGRGIRSATKADYERALEARAIPFFERRLLAEIETRHIKEFATHLADGGASPATVRNLMAPVRALFATAVEEGLIRHNPAIGVRLPGRRSDEPDADVVKALTDPQLDALLAELDGTPRLMIRFLADTGLRVGEMLALRWSDLDFGSRRVQVRRRLYRGEEAGPKSRYGRRDVPLSQGLAQELWRHRAESRFPGDQDHVFSTSRGTPYRREAVYARMLKPAAERAGIPAATVHMLRHTCATRLFRAGLNAKQVQVWLGHHSPAFTLATYVHLLPDDLPDPVFFEAPGPGGVTRVSPRPTETDRDDALGNRM